MRLSLIALIFSYPEKAEFIPSIDSSIPFNKRLRGCLVCVFKQQFSVSKQHFTHFNIFFHPHVFSQMFLNNNFQFLNTHTKRTLRLHSPHAYLPPFSTSHPPKTKKITKETTSIKWLPYKLQRKSVLLFVSQNSYNY